jgi:hypothetical protein
MERLIRFHSAGLEAMPWWTGKAAIREYLASVNANGKVSNSNAPRSSLTSEGILFLKAFY